MVRADQSLQSLHDIAPDVEFPKIKKMKGKSISLTESLPKKTYGSL